MLFQSATQVLRCNPDATWGHPMLAIAYNIKVAPRVSSWTRNFATSRCALRPPIEAQKYIQFLGQRSQNQIWRLVNSLDTPVEVDHIFDILHSNKVSVNDFKKWESVIYHLDISEAVDTLKASGFKTSPPERGDAVAPCDTPTKPIPSWVLLSLVGHRVNTPAHASGPLLDLVFSHLDSESSEIRGPLLILTTYHLARFNLVVPFQHVLDAFLNTKLFAPGIQFNGLLQALSFMPFRSAETSKNITTLIKAMDERKLNMTPSTYKALLKDKFCELDTAQHLFIRMTKSKDFKPKPVLFQHFINVFTNNGRRDLALKFYKAIERMLQAPGEPDDAFVKARSRAKLSILNSSKSRTEAKQFLRTTADTDSEEWTKAYNETAAFNVSAKDPDVDSKQLIDIFLILPTKPSIVTYTILIRGLLHRREYRNALIFWKKLANQSTLVMDRNALTAGLEAFIRNGKPHEAFQVMEKYCRRPGFDYNDLYYDGPPPVELNTISMNEILVALNRIKRPDAVFRLWDHMGTLYGCTPNAMTLSILLQAAKIARRLDDSLSGIIAKVKLLNPFKTKFAPNEHQDPRLQAVNDIISCIGHPSRGTLRRYTTGIWKGQEPIDFVTKIFLRVLFGNDRRGQLLSVESPANAILKAYDAAPSSPFSSPKKYVFHPFPGLLTPNGQSHYPQIVITNVNCLMYITLIGVGGRAGEIPLVLAWMRELGVVPSTPLLAASLVFWSEISAQAPLVELWAGGPEKNEFTKLVQWIREWVGEKRMPGDKLMIQWRRTIYDMRTAGNRAEYEKIKDIWS